MQPEKSYLQRFSAETICGREQVTQVNLAKMAVSIGKCPNLHSLSTVIL